jgi:hypothetical protein
MEDVLSVYERPYDPLRPLVCIDERLKELRGTPNGSLMPRPGQPKRQDYEYERNGTCNTFMSVEPLIGVRRVHVTEKRTYIDFAEELRLLVDEVHPDAEMIVLVTDNLNTHSRAALYERFLPDEALRIADKIEWHYTPEHGSWLNMAEIELSVLSKQCLNRRIATIEDVEREVTAWQDRRNLANSKIRWQFTTADARIKLRRLYPEIA